MTPEFRAKWVAALRSGEYQQGKGALRKGDKFCCLGVACDLLDPSGWESTSITGSLAWNGYASSSPRDLPFIDPGKAVRLAIVNDDGCRFDQIADYIEAYVI